VCNHVSHLREATGNALAGFCRMVLYDTTHQLCSLQGGVVTVGRSISFESIGLKSTVMRGSNFSKL